INAVKSQVDAELQPLVTSLESAEQAEAQRVSAESNRVSAEAQRKTDHANRSAELASKADKVTLNNLITNGDFSDGLTGWDGIGNGDELIGNKVVLNHTGDTARYIYHTVQREIGNITYSRLKLKV